MNPTLTPPALRATVRQLTEAAQAFQTLQSQTLEQVVRELHEATSETVTTLLTATTTALAVKNPAEALRVQTDLAKTLVAQAAARSEKARTFALDTHGAYLAWFERAFTPVATAA